MEIINDTCQSLEPCLPVRSCQESVVSLRSSHLIDSFCCCLCASWQFANKNKSYKVGILILLAPVE